MINKIKCLLTGHKFLMSYYPAYSAYYPRVEDKCACCDKSRGAH